MPEKSVSFRTHLQSNTSDLLRGASIDCMHTVRLVIGLVSHLAAYTEEGRALAPAVFICNSVSNLVGMAGAGEYVELSDDIDTDTGASSILKVAAPLCCGSWRIYIERRKDGKKCKFGVFCGSNDPSSLTVDEVVLSEANAGNPVVRISQSVTNKVEVRTSSGNAIEFRFNDDDDVPHLNDGAKVSHLAAAVVGGVNPADPTFEGFMLRALTSAIANSHGTLIAVTSDNDDSFPAQLNDAVILKPALDLFSRFQLHLDESKTAISVSRLQTAADLLSGFVNSDGITVISSTGKILGYRAFVKSDEPTTPSEGGARTRAFAALSELVGNGLDAAFFRSQDGRVKIKMLQE